MKTVLLDFGRNNSICDLKMKEMKQVLEEAGVQCVFVKIGEVKGCTGCGKCWKKRRCVIEDEVNLCADAMQDSDGLILGFESYYGRCEEDVMRFVKRLFHSASDVLDHKLFSCVIEGRRTESAFFEAGQYMMESHMCLYVPDEFGKAEKIKSRRGELVLLLRCHERAVQDGILRKDPYVCPYERFVR